MYNMVTLVKSMIFREIPSLRKEQSASAFTLGGDSILILGKIKVAEKVGYSFRLEIPKGIT